MASRRGASRWAGRWAALLVLLVVLVTPAAPAASKEEDLLAQVLGTCRPRHAAARAGQGRAYWRVAADVRPVRCRPG
jgi:hypothetical protein